MKTRQSFPVISAVALLVLGVGCATTTDDRAPLSSYNQGGGAGIVTYLMSPKDNQSFPAGKDITLQAGANNIGGINRVEFIVNGKRIAQDFKRPYTAVLSKPSSGTYVIHSVAYSIYGASKSSPGIVITVK